MTTTTTTAIKSTPAPAAQRWAPRPSPFFPVPEVQWDAESGEPYLAIEGHPDLHLTPFHDTQEDAEALVSSHVLHVVLLTPDRECQGRVLEPWRTISVSWCQ